MLSLTADYSLRRKHRAGGWSKLFSRFLSVIGSPARTNHIQHGLARLFIVLGSAAILGQRSLFLFIPKIVTLRAAAATYNLMLLSD
jgi:hypothetical protein